MYYIPWLWSNIISIGQWDEIGVKMVVEKGVMSLFDHQSAVLVCVVWMPNRLYSIHLNLTEPVSLLA